MLFRSSLTRQRLLQFASRQMHEFSPNGKSYKGKSNPTHLNKLSSRVANKIDNHVLRHILPNKKPILSTVTNQVLKAYYINEINELEDLLDRDLSKWK